MAKCKSKPAKNPVVPTIVYKDSEEMGDVLAVWPAILPGDDPLLQIDPDHACMCETSRTIHFRREDAPKLAAAILAAAMTESRAKRK
ncbi:hypothetical protein SA2016_1244 [Sinomonas atrocyanea]|uniref:Uncharacterized protein n=1 Tax=Sinomonas atrocyanea TaxID=37927 RepID=A0A126ZZW2_9MICC|nr:hypothetical protein [Sinomonas atrocyanea]AMM31925.1 hypothetical protein SA2016_1244 [Sinomonas atrocyanea]GEB65957.1 hypothetical protein SAT01_34050 [Sinomonas atrocyanea]GGG65750.1 hypothetical protein GCM10007172_16540 [Sinomonas atrocyanea]